MEVRPGDLDEVAEDLVELYLEGGDPGALAFTRLEAGDVALAAMADGAQFIDFRRVARADDARFRGRGGRIVGDRLFDQPAGVLHRVDFGADFLEAGGAKLRQERLQRGGRPEGLGQRHQLAGVGDSGADAADQPLQVEDPTQEFGEPPQRGAGFREGGDTVEPPLEFRHVQEGEQQPALEQPGAHSRAGPVEQGQERSLPRAVHGGYQLQVDDRGGVELHEIGRFEKAEFRHLPERPELAVAQVMDQCAGGGERQRPAGGAEAVQAGDAEVFEQYPLGIIAVIGPVVQKACHPLIGPLRPELSVQFLARYFGQENFLRPESGQLVEGPGPGILP